jgi:hypothetical protein
VNLGWPYDNLKKFELLVTRLKPIMYRGLQVIRKDLSIYCCQINEESKSGNNKAKVRQVRAKNYRKRKNRASRTLTDTCKRRVPVIGLKKQVECSQTQFCHLALPEMIVLQGFIAAQ